MAIVFDTTETSGWRRSTVINSSSNTTIVADKPTAVVEGDLMVAVIHNNAALNPGTITHPSGWTQAVTNTNLNGNFRMHTTYAWKIAGASEPSDYTWTVGASVADDSVIIIRASGFDAENVVDAVGAEKRHTGHKIVILTGSNPGTNRHEPIIQSNACWRNQ